MRISWRLLFCLLSPAMLLFAAAGLYGGPLPQKDYLIGPGDILEVQVWGHDDLQRTVTVSQEGAFTFPLIDTVRTAGLSAVELEELMRERLADGYLVRPQVSITVRGYHSQKAFLFGAVRKPGAYTLMRTTPLLELIAEAGGLTDKAGHIVKIVRASSPDQETAVSLEEARQEAIITVDLRQLPGDETGKALVHNRDSVYVLEVARIFVTGEVNSPGHYPWDPELTVRQAISFAGGASKRGAVNRTTIIRQHNGREEEFRPSMSDTLHPLDIIKVPQSYF